MTDMNRVTMIRTSEKIERTRQNGPENCTHLIDKSAFGTNFEKFSTRSSQTPSSEGKTSPQETSARKK